MSSNTKSSEQLQAALAAALADAKNEAIKEYTDSAAYYNALDEATQKELDTLTPGFRIDYKTEALGLQLSNFESNVQRSFDLEELLRSELQPQELGGDPDTVRKLLESLERMAAECKAVLSAGGAA